MLNLFESDSGDLSHKHRNISLFSVRQQLPDVRKGPDISAQLLTAISIIQRLQISCSTIISLLLLNNPEFMIV